MKKSDHRSNPHLNRSLYIEYPQSRMCISFAAIRGVISLLPLRKAKSERKLTPSPQHQKGTRHCFHFPPAFSTLPAVSCLHPEYCLHRAKRLAHLEDKPFALEFDRNSRKDEWEDSELLTIRQLSNSLSSIPQREIQTEENQHKHFLPANPRDKLSTSNFNTKELRQ